MSKYRSHQRFLTLRTAKVITETMSIECAVLDISVGGACILLPKNRELPETFDLVIDHTDDRLACTLVWTDDTTNGVQFVRPLPFLPECWAI